MSDQVTKVGGSGPGDGLPASHEVRAALEAVLSSDGFAQSSRQQKFLRHVVEETLAGRSASLKEYSLALEVFDRDESFDPQTSSIVRVEASRLRSKLQQYYATVGRQADVRIEIPTGTYVPTFVRSPREASPAARDAVAAVPVRTGAWDLLHRPSLHLLLLVVVLAALAGFLVFLGRQADPPPGAAVGAKPSVAVLPLRNLSSQADQDYLSDGMTDALITNLAKNRTLHVISLTSAMAYKNVNRPVGEIARELNVAHVVEGSVLRAGGRIRITAQLIEAGTDRHLWAESYERDIADVLAVQEEVSSRIVAALLGRVGSEAAISAKPARSLRPAAHEAYLKGLYFRNQMTEEGFKKGVGYFKQAISEDPGYAEAYSGMATCYCLLGGHGFEIVDPREGMPSAKQAVLEAMALDDTLAEPHAFLGIIRLKYEWDWPGAEASFKRALELNPSYAQARIFYSFYLEAMGRQDEAIREAEAAREIDPLSLQANTNLGWQYLRAGRSDAARQQFEATAELAPRFWGAHWGMGHYYRYRREFVEAVSAYEKAIELGGGHALPVADLGYTYAAAGRTTEARRVIAELQTMAEKAYVSPYTIATIHAGLGDADEAFRWLEEAFKMRSRSLAWLNVASEYDGLRSDPRFKSLARRIGLPSLP
jgi:adenylate cyclase